MIRISLVGVSNSKKTETLEIISSLLKKDLKVEPEILPSSPLIVQGLTGLNPSVQDSDDFHLYSMFWRRMWEFEALQQPNPILSTSNAISDMAYQKSYLDKLVNEAPGIVVPGQPNVQQAKQVASMSVLQTMMYQAVYEVLTYWQWIYYCTPQGTGTDTKYQTSVDNNIKLFTSTLATGRDKIRIVPTTDVESFFESELEEWKAFDMTEMQELGLIVKDVS